MLNQEASGQATTRDVGRRLVVATLAQASDADRALLMRWAQHLLAIRDSDRAFHDKARGAISSSINSQAIWPFIKMASSELKRLAWDERNAPARSAIAMAGAATMLLAAQGAGIAAVGGAIAVPLWVVFGDGDQFAGAIIDEVKRDIARRSGGADFKVVDENFGDDRSRYKVA
jgi:hypothetical protein